MKLAVMSGNVNVDKMLRGITAKQFMEWESYYNIDPFDKKRDDYRTALLCSLIANVNRDSKKNKTPFKLEDFLLEFKELEGKKRTQTVKEQFDILMLIAKAQARSKPK